MDSNIDKNIDFYIKFFVYFARHLQIPKMLRAVYSGGVRADAKDYKRVLRQS